MLALNNSSLKKYHDKHYAKVNYLNIIQNIFKLRINLKIFNIKNIAGAIAQQLPALAAIAEDLG